jgi:hypothetical protein
MQGSTIEKEDRSQRIWTSSLTTTQPATRHAQDIQQASKDRKDGAST